jgi:hypothetical protein
MGMATNNFVLEHKQILRKFADIKRHISISQQRDYKM